MKKLLSACAVLAACVALQAAAETLAERIQPVGSVCMAGDACAAAPATQVAAASGPRSGDTIYNTKCMTCHGTGAAGAPKLGDAAAWEPRLAQGVDTLYTHAIKGFNAMPAKGLCFDCSDEELKAAVDHMVANAK